MYAIKSTLPFLLSQQDDFGFMLNLVSTSVRAMQYVLDININAKKSDDLVHFLPYKCYRIWPLVLWSLPEDFQKLAYSEKFS